ncbi:protein phosphatase 2C domain-containing protein [Nodosilinea sp. LEGE 07088]|uniref:PP2C family serine/threonine-protein phosphatase n=1 Tax=Nodosilinea sp. LEGE 07088 TaxID=2777968 RepID=UPI001882129C|nr:protein phosphatase 2C domain-containing protein [Nodosilinea sp. LEGE 07088]
MGWRAIARSAIGTRHQEQQQPCQDYGAVVVAAPRAERDRHGVIVGAVADGAGSARHSDIGAKLAVATTLRYLAGSEAWLQKRQRSWQRWPQAPSAELMRRVFTKAVVRSQTQIAQRANAQGWEPDDLACTLLAFLATPDWLAAMQIGDGFMVMSYGQPEVSGVPANADYQLLFRPDRGEFANQTTFITAANALATMQVAVVGQPPRFIAAATDGLERVALRLKDWAPFAPFFSPLEEYLWETPHPEADDAYLISFLTSERLNQKTDDDKTLVLCRYEA